MSKRVQGLRGIAILIVLGIASGATAQSGQYQMSGTWTQNRGPLVDIPVIPGFIPGMGSIGVMGPNLTTITLPPLLFSQMGGALFPLFGTTLVQLSTMLDGMGPQSSGMFRQGPMLSTRPNANFAWCPATTQFMAHPSNPLCPNGNQVLGMTTMGMTGINKLPGRVRYVAASPQYGGTAQMLLVGGGEVSVVVASPGTMTFFVLHNPFGGGGASNDQEAGGPYGNQGSVMLAAGDITVETMNPVGMVITAPGPIAPFPYSMGPPETNLTVGFPWTVGMVQATNPTAVAIQPPSGSMLTLTGMDNRGPGGVGNLVMVAGAMTRRTVAQNTFMHLDILNMNIAGAVPSMSLGGYAAGGTLLVLLAGYFLRRRLA